MTPEQLRCLRYWLGRSQKEMAALIGVGISSYSMWENPYVVATDHPKLETFRQKCIDFVNSQR